MSTKTADERLAGPTTRYRVRCPGCGYSDRFRSKGNAIRVQKHGCPECGRGVGVSKVRADPDNQQLVTDGGLAAVGDEFPVITGQVSDPDGATAYQVLAVRVEPENHEKLERAGFHSPETLFALFSPGGTPLADYDEYRIARECPGADNGWIVDQLQALADSLRAEVSDGGSETHA